ncbi:MAG TPA: hypothetical protein VKJ65_01665 [Phycisphaerae bacterium]|nr:hypothetical protein [Phycisphaerae bacterium]
MADPKHPPLPTAGELKRAIDIYIRLAYSGVAVPDFVTARMKPILAAPAEAPANPSWFEVAQKEDRSVYRLRLGQKAYPHMKLTLEETPDAGSFLFSADAHDSHLYAPTGSPDEQGLMELRKNNAQLVTQIESAWTQENIPTFRGYLRRSLAKKS